MAELNSNDITKETAVMVNPNEVNQIYTDDTDRSVIDEITLQLKPFASTMRKALNRRGINADGLSFNNLVIKFYNEFLLKPNEKALPVNFLSDNALTTVKVSQFDKYCDSVDAGKIESYTKTAGTIVTAASGLFAGIRNRAKAKTAQAMADAGRYNELSPFQKSLIAVPDYINAPPLTQEQKAMAADVDKVVTGLENKNLLGQPINVKSILIIVGILIVIVTAYFIFRKK